MKLEETENPKLQYVDRIETNTTQINNIHDSDVDLTEKITESLNIYAENPNFKVKPSFKKWCNFIEDTDTALPNVDKNNRIIKTNRKSKKNQTNHSTNT